MINEQFIDRLINVLIEMRLDKKLKGKQKKLDVNNSGSLDAEDFKMLRAGKKGRADESKNSGDIRKFMKSHAGKMTSMSSSFTDPAISAKKLARAGEHRKAGRKKQARDEVRQSEKLDKPQLP